MTQRRSLAAAKVSKRCQPRRSSRIPAALHDMIYDKPKAKKVLQHVRLDKRKTSDAERSDDSGYEESDRSSLSSSSPKPSIGSQDDVMNEDSSSNRAIKEFNVSNKEALRPVFVSDADESDSDSESWPQARGSRKGIRNDYNQSCQNHLSVEGEMQTRTHSTRRMLMKEWMVYNLDEESFPGMKWYNKKERLCQITWKHRSAGAWCRDDVKHFEAWATYTGRHESDRDFKRWKANFRCALNILPDVKEEISLRNAKGKNPYKVYRILESQTRRRRTKSGQNVSAAANRITKSRQSVMTISEEEEESKDGATVHDLSYNMETQLAVEQLELAMDPENSIETWKPITTTMDIERSLDISPESFLTISSDDGSSNIQPWSSSCDMGLIQVSLASAVTSKPGSLTILPSVSTLFSPLPDSLQDTYCTSPEVSLIPMEFNQLSEGFYENLQLTPELEYSSVLNESDLFTLNSLISDKDRCDLTELQNCTFESPFDCLSVSTPVSNNITLPLMIEEINSQ